MHLRINVFVEGKPPVRTSPEDYRYTQGRTTALRAGCEVN
jgi:hypothetical protein